MVPATDFVSSLEFGLDVLDVSVEREQWIQAHPMNFAIFFPICTVENI